MSPDLNMGVMECSFHSVGTTPVVFNERENRWCNIGVNGVAQAWRTKSSMPSGPRALMVCRILSSWYTSSKLSKMSEIKFVGLANSFKLGRIKSLLVKMD